MKRVTYDITPDTGYFDPGEVVLRDADATLSAILDIDHLADESVVLQYVVDGDASALEASLSTRGTSVRSYELFERSAETVLQIHFEPGDPLRSLLDLHRRHGVLYEFPLRFVEPSTPKLRLTEVGPESELRSLIAAKREQLDVTITEVGSYEPTTVRQFARLTDRQREVLVAAVELGYYDSPRRATYEDVAALVDASPSAVGKVLRRIEAEVFSSIVPSSGQEDGQPGRHSERVG